jgi:tetratricopeptide (TPR) repeat protein/DNA-binding protein Fis
MPRAKHATYDDREAQRLDETADKLNTESVSVIDDWNDFEAELRDAIRLYKQAQFGEELGRVANALHLFLQEHQDRHNSSFWKALTLIYELNDIFHFDSAINNDALNQGKLLYKDFRLQVDDWEPDETRSKEEKELAKRQVLYCTCYANELKRHGKVEAAREVLEWLLNFTELKLHDEKAFRSFGTQAWITYYLGAVYRILEKHNLAEGMYTQTLELLYKRGKYEQREDERLFMIRRQAMAIGLGLGWVSASRGALQRSQNALTTARSLLTGIKDPIVPYYVDLLYGITMRCKAGRNQEKLREAVDILVAARKSFETHKQHRFVPAASWELSQAYNLLEEFEEADKCLKKVADYAEELRHPKWLINVHIQRSRVARNQKDYNAALSHAQRALNEAMTCKSVLPITTAYITLGEAKFESLKAQGGNPNYETARADFENALELITRSQDNEEKSYYPSNPKIVAVCELRIAQCFARDTDEIKARLHFTRWEILRPIVEHEFVREMGEQVKREIEELSMNFTISARNSNEWDYVANVTRLRNWLLNQALRQTKRNYSKAAELLGVKRGTLYQWQDDSRSKSQLRARTKP